ncbi:transporter [Dokdonia sp. Asnod2-E02]|uniref:transporter n=1 Tax=Dokdonia sp. Asnod2-E02 TaxID=3160574 RepID=UPI0038686E1E
MKNFIMALLAIAMTTVLSAQETQTQNPWSSNRPDGHAPISVMGDHTHKKGEFMISYRYMNMQMNDLKRGSDDVSFESVLLPNGGEYMVTPTDMPMNMHMLGGMYAVSNKVTLAAMLGYTSMDMEHLTAMGGNFETSSSGISDLKISGLVTLFNKNRQQLHAKVGVSLPTGSIDEMDVTPASMGNEVILPYPMQLGSGTLDALLGATYIWQSDSFSGGNQLDAVVRTGTNDRDYRLGNSYALNNWVAYKATDWISFSARVKGTVASEIDGANPDLNPLMVITADTRNSGGTYIDGGLGFNLYANKGTLKNVRFGLEFATPLLQDVNGVQLKRKETITAGLQYAF